MSLHGIALHSDLSVFAERFKDVSSLIIADEQNFQSVTPSIISFLGELFLRRLFAIKYNRLSERAVKKVQNVASAHSASEVYGVYVMSHEDGDVKRANVYLHHLQMAIG